MGRGGKNPDLTITGDIPEGNALTGAQRAWVIWTEHVLLAGEQSLVKQAQYNAPTGTFTIPPRTTAVFLER